MEVQIIEISTGNLIKTYLIVLKGENYTPSDQDYFNEAWCCAVEDELVPHRHREKYSFRLVR